MLDPRQQDMYDCRSLRPECYWDKKAKQCDVPTPELKQLFPDDTCQRIAAYGRGHETGLDKIGNPINFYLGPGQNYPLEYYDARRQLILQKTLGRLPNLQTDFKITKQLISIIVVLIDRVYFDETLMSTIMDDTKSTFEIVFEDVPNGSQASMICNRASPVNILRINLANWKIEEPRIVDDVYAPSRLMGLILAVEHELVHLIIDKFSEHKEGDSGHHGELFRAVNRAVFGHSSIEYQWAYPKDVEEHVYVVESIINHRENHGVTEYLVKWEGYPSEANSWEPKTSFDNQLPITAYWDTLRQFRPPKRKLNHKASGPNKRPRGK